MKQLFEEELPFSDYVILYFVDLFGVYWVDFYHVILMILFGLFIGGWVIAIYAYTKCNRAIADAVEEEQNKQ